MIMKGLFTILSINLWLFIFQQLQFLTNSNLILNAILERQVHVDCFNMSFKT